MLGWSSKVANQAAVVTSRKHRYTGAVSQCFVIHAVVSTRNAAPVRGFIVYFYQFTSHGDDISAPDRHMTPPYAIDAQRISERLNGNHQALARHISLQPDKNSSQQFPLVFYYLYQQYKPNCRFLILRTNWFQLVPGANQIFHC